MAAPLGQQYLVSWRKAIEAPVSRREEAGASSLWEPDIAGSLREQLQHGYFNRLSMRNLRSLSPKSGCSSKRSVP